MINFGKIIQNLKSDAARVGFSKSIFQLFYYAANKIFLIRRLEIIYLNREHLAVLDPKKYTKHSSRLATEEELLRMQTEGLWDMTDELIEGFRGGDSCLLSFIEGKLAGYAWVHSGGRALFFAGLRVRIPETHVYNFASFTLPDFRGYGLQPYRHHEFLALPGLREKKGMIGFVECTNWGSKRGQAKSGYQRLGYMTLVGTAKNFITLVSKEVSDLGIRRLSN